MSRKQHSIGMFDSGMGGLTVMRELQNKLPKESIIYFGDTARIPYGGKSPETIVRFSIENSIFLMEKDIKLLVVACNTASSYAIPKLRKIFNIPVIDVIQPGAEKAAQVTKNQRIAVLGTKATVHSNAYEVEIKKILPQAHVHSIACPLFVPLVEERFLNHHATKLIVEDTLKPLQNQNIDTIVLGCTHYPVLKDLIQEVMGPQVTIVDSASTCADKVAAILEAEKLAHQHENPEHAFYVSDDPEKFKTLGKDFLGKSIAHVNSTNFS